jgi:hypothetical protein
MRVFNGTDVVALCDYARSMTATSSLRSLHDQGTSMSRHALTASAAVLITVLGTATATAQRLSFERTFDVSGPVDLDVTTMRGKIDVRAGEPGRVVVSGTVTVRVGWGVPPNALSLARNVAGAPPVELDMNTIRLRPPADAVEQRAVTVAYRVRVPPSTTVRSTTDSGSTTVQDVFGAVVVATQSSSIVLSALGGAATVTTGSGEVRVNGVRGPLAVETSSSAFTGRGLASSLRVRTSSGNIDADMTGTGDVDVQTSSSAIRVNGAGGGAAIATRSGRVVLQGTPRREWSVTTSSSSVDVTLDVRAMCTWRACPSTGQRPRGSPAEPSGAVGLPSRFVVAAGRSACADAYLPSENAMASSSGDSTTSGGRLDNRRLAGRDALRGTRCGSRCAEVGRDACRWLRPYPQCGPLLLEEQRAAVAAEVRTADRHLQAAQYGALSQEPGNPLPIGFLDANAVSHITELAEKFDDVVKRAAFVTHCGAKYFTQFGALHCYGGE